MKASRRTFSRKLLCILTLVLFLTPCAAMPQKQILSMNEAILLALRNNSNVENAEIQRVVDKYALIVAHNEFELQYDFTANGSHTRSHRNRETSSTNNVNAIPSTSIRTTFGTDIKLTMNNPYDGSDYNPELSLDIAQPLMRGFGPAVTKANLNNAKDQEKVNKLSLKRTVIDTVTTIIADYRKLILDKVNLNIQKIALKNAAKTVEQNKVRIRAGKMAETENIQARAQVADQKFSVTQAENTIKQDRLKLLTDIGLDPESNIDIPNDFKMEKIKIPKLEDSKNLAFENNIEYITSRIGLKVSKRDLLVAKDNARIQLDLDLKAATGGGFGGGKNAGFTSLYNGANHTQSVSLELTIPIDDKPLKQAVANSKVRVKQSETSLRQQERDLERQVMDSIRNLKTQRQQIILAKNAENLSKRSLDIAQKKLHYGRATVFEITSLRSSLTQAKQRVISNEISYLNTLTDFESLLGTTLDVWGIKIRY